MKGYTEHDKVDCVTETSLAYADVEVYVGDTVSLSCNTSSDVMWTYHYIDDGYVQYVYWNDQIDSSQPQLSVNVTELDFVSLIISDVQFTDIGHYDCYDNSGLRTVGYHVTVNGMCYFYHTT